MDIGLFLLGVLLTVVPMIELRGGLPVALYAIKGSGPLIFLLTFLLIVVINIILIFLLFLFLETLHHKLLKWKFYNKHFEKYLTRIQRKSHKITKKQGLSMFFSLFLFVAIPLPLTGAYTGVLLAWFLDLDKSKSIIAIASGILVAGILIFLFSTGMISLLF